jgi:hypothetical protein
MKKEKLMNLPHLCDNTPVNTPVGMEIYDKRTALLEDLMKLDEILHSVLSNMTDLYDSRTMRILRKKRMSLISNLYILLLRLQTEIEED